MPNFNPIRINLEDLSNTPILDGQLLFVTNQDNGKNPIYLDIGSTRKQLGVYNWDAITNKPFDSIGDGLFVEEGTLKAVNVTWANILDKPFSAIGDGLIVNQNNELTTDVEWNDILAKPFNAVGSGLTVNQNNELTADAQAWSQILNKPFNTIGAGLDVINNELVAIGGGTGVDWSTEVINKPFETIGGGLKVTDGALETDITLAWSSVIGKPFESIGTGLTVVNDELTTNFAWSNVSGKPFNTIGSGLTVENNALKVNATFAWDDVTSKPFNTIGDGLTVVNNTTLTANIKTVTLTTTGTASYNTVRKQSLTVNGSDSGEILGTKYMERNLTLDTSNQNIYSFTSSEINTNSVIDVFSSIYNFNPSDIRVIENTGQGTCTVEVEFPPYSTAGTSMLCRIYIR